MFNIEIDESSIVYQEGTSEGTQVKYYKDGYWYKLDNHGVSLLTANQSINKSLTISENVERVIARPFSGSFEKTKEYFGPGITFDKEGILKWLADEPESFEKRVLAHQLASI